MEEFSNIIILITCASDDEAKEIKKILLDDKKAACINIISGVNSFFWWKGKIDSSQEVLLMVKTRLSVFEEVVYLVKKVHGYEVPEIIALPIIAGNKDYLNWIKESIEE